MKRNAGWLIGGVFTFLFVASTWVQAAPLVTFTTSGTSGNYVLDFSVTNTLGVENLDIYFFGIEASSGDVSGAPTANWTEYASWNPIGFGGPDISYNGVWLDYGASIGDMIQNGETLSGFTFNVTSTSAPTSVNWFAFASDWMGSGASYAGSDSFNRLGNPGFAGVAGADPSAVPEPTTLMLLGSGLVGLVALRRRGNALPQHADCPCPLPFIRRGLLYMGISGRAKRR